jgi:excisionase family DNA binding protein
MASDDTHLELAEAARELGVHYQTAYRWVRDGSLRALKQGKSYRVERGDLERFAERRHAGRPPAPLRVRDWQHQVDRVHDLLVDGDERGARDAVDRLVTGGISPIELCDRLLAPVLRRIGADWEAGRRTVAEEHRASAICERLLARLPTRRTRARGTAVVATPAGEHHGLPALMAATALRYDGWRVHHLATDLPDDDLARFVEEHRPDLLVLSTTVTDATSTSVAQQAAEAVGARVLVGRPGGTLDELVVTARGILSNT